MGDDKDARIRNLEQNVEYLISIVANLAEGMDLQGKAHSELASTVSNLLQANQEMIISQEDIKRALYNQGERLKQLDDNSSKLDQIIRLLSSNNSSGGGQ